MKKLTENGKTSKSIRKTPMYYRSSTRQKLESKHESVYKIHQLPAFQQTMKKNLTDNQANH